MVQYTLVLLKTTTLLETMTDERSLVLIRAVVVILSAFLTAWLALDDCGMRILLILLKKEQDCLSAVDAMSIICMVSFLVNLILRILIIRESKKHFLVMNSTTKGSALFLGLFAAVMMTTFIGTNAIHTSGFAKEYSDRVYRMLTCYVFGVVLPSLFTLSHGDIRSHALQVVRHSVSTAVRAMGAPFRLVGRVLRRLQDLPALEPDPDDPLDALD